MELVNGIAWVSLLTIIWLLTGAHGYGGWELAHATFYGGSDVSGTMGKIIP